MGSGSPDSDVVLHFGLGALAPKSPGLLHVVHEQPLAANYPNGFNHESVVTQLL